MLFGGVVSVSPLCDPSLAPCASFCCCMHHMKYENKTSSQVYVCESVYLCCGIALGFALGFALLLLATGSSSSCMYVAPKKQYWRPHEYTHLCTCGGLSQWYDVVWCGIIGAMKCEVYRYTIIIRIQESRWMWCDFVTYNRDSYHDVGACITLLTFSSEE